MKAAAFEYQRARDAADAVRLLATGGADAKAIAGGQSLGPMLNLRLARPSLLVDIRQCPDLQAVHDEGDAILYGAALTHAAFEDARVRDATPGWLAPLARGIAYRAVRNRGTVGGSLAHADPAADWPSALLALGAEVIILGPDGARAMPLDGFALAPFAVDIDDAELLTAIRVPKRGAGARWGYWKYCRKTGEFAKAIAAFLHDPDLGETRAVVGAAERAPVLLTDSEVLLEDPGAADSLIADQVPGLSAVAARLHATALRRAAARVTEPKRRAA